MEMGVDEDGISAGFMFDFILFWTVSCSSVEDLRRDISLLRYVDAGAIVTLNKLDRVLSLICPNLLKQD